VRAHAEAGRALAGRRPFDLRVLAELASTADEIARANADEPVDPSEPRPADPHGHWHALRVATLGVAMGARQLHTFGWLDHTHSPRFDRIDERLANFGSGLMLHDIGKLALPEALRTASGSLSPEQQKAFERHADAGASVLPDSMVPVPVRVVVRSHHERWDGTGFPQGKAGDAIHELARIAAVADAYDVVTSSREGRPGLARHAALHLIEGGAGTQFDPTAVALLQAIVPAHAIGHEVCLLDGRRAVIARVDPEQPSRLTVRVAGGERRVEELSVDVAELADPADRAA
jgi:HD-GYP domain-containing protein (c-di-GMP phosphodiesterase class II)